MYGKKFLLMYTMANSTQWNRGQIEIKPINYTVGEQKCLWITNHFPYLWPQRRSDGLRFFGELAENIINRVILYSVHKKSENSRMKTIRWKIIERSINIYICIYIIIFKISISIYSHDLFKLLFIFLLIAMIIVTKYDFITLYIYCSVTKQSVGRAIR